MRSVRLENLLPLREARDFIDDTRTRKLWQTGFPARQPYEPATNETGLGPNDSVKRVGVCSDRIVSVSRRAAARGDGGERCPVRVCEVRSPLNLVRIRSKH